MQTIIDNLVQTNRRNNVILKTLIDAKIDAPVTYAANNMEEKIIVMKKERATYKKAIKLLTFFKDKEV